VEQTTSFALENTDWTRRGAERESALLSLPRQPNVHEDDRRKSKRASATFRTKLRDVRKRVFSGIQPSGEITLGNYLGAVRTWRQQVEAGSEDTMFCITPRP
jgi:hypothetical protein